MSSAPKADLILPPEAVGRPRLVASAPPRAQARLSLAAVPRAWHLLSLDAPTVAVLWAWMLARAVDRAPDAASLAVLGFGTWLVYVVDRLLDGRPGTRRDHLRERHFFHARHRRPLIVACCVAALPLFWLIAIMPATTRSDDALLFLIAMVDFCLVHIAARRPRRWIPREFAVGILFALATAVPASSRPAPLRLIPLVLLLAALCSLNCLAIESWERPISLPRSRVVRWFATGVAAAALILLAATTFAASAAAILASALLLLALDRQARQFRPLTLRIAADAALLTPLLFLLPR